MFILSASGTSKVETFSQKWLCNEHLGEVIFVRYFRCKVSKNKLKNLGQQHLQEPSVMSESERIRTIHCGRT